MREVERDEDVPYTKSPNVCVRAISAMRAYSETVWFRENKTAALQII